MKNNSKDELLIKASELSKKYERPFILTSTKKIISKHDNEATKLLIKELKDISQSTKETNTKELVSDIYDLIIYFYGFEKLIEIYNASIDKVDTRSLEELMMELNSLIGLNDVKKEIDHLIAFQKVQQLRKNMNLKLSSNTLHIAFLGNPGTGKTTVARIIGHIYKEIGLLSKGHFIEVSRSDLIAEYQGQTAIKVNKVLSKAKGGVLFIDEAYSITENDQVDSYGRECITELTKTLEDDREDLVVIVAGYTKQMNDFFLSNPGLKSRFNKFIHFNDFTTQELIEIFDKNCKDNEYIYTDSALKKIRLYIDFLVSNETELFGNGRDIRNFFDDVIFRQAKRISQIKTEIDKAELITLTDEDIPSVNQNQSLT